MSSEENQIFNQRIQSVYQQTQSLHKNADRMLQHHPQLVLDCLQELWSALEELHVAEETLREQNEALVAAKEQANRERQRYQNLFEFAPDGYLVTDIHGMVIEANRAAAILFDQQQQQLPGKLLAHQVQANQRRAFRALLNQLPRVNRIQEWELTLCGQNNRSFEAAITVETVRDSQGQVVALRWLIRDITTRKQSEERLRQLQVQNLQLLEADRLKSQFIATISHELRTPLNAILGFSHLLLRQFHEHPNPQLVNMVERIFRNGNHLLTLIEEMLDFSTLKANRLELHPEPFDLMELITATVEELRPLADHKMLELTVQGTQPQLVIVNDRVRIRQMVTNLLSNAIKFTETGGVTVEAWELPEERIILIVQDTGMGIAPDNQARIFQEFWQINQSTTRQQQGTGLGLAIVQALVKLMAGSISVESEVGHGSNFRIELPRWLGRPVSRDVTKLV